MTKWNGCQIELTCVFAIVNSELTYNKGNTTPSDGWRDLNSNQPNTNLRTYHSALVKMEITPCSEDKLEIQFLFVENRNRVRRRHHDLFILPKLIPYFLLQIAVTAKFNLIDHVFQNLTSLYFMRSAKVSTQYLVSQLVGSEVSDEKLIGSVVPLSSLESLCESSLEFKNVMVSSFKPILSLVYCIYCNKLNIQSHIHIRVFCKSARWIRPWHCTQTVKYWIAPHT